MNELEKKFMDDFTKLVDDTRRKGGKFKHIDTWISTDAWGEKVYLTVEIQEP